MLISDHTLQKIRESDLVNIIGQYVKLKRNGNRYIGYCPFHNEKTPSFNVRPGKGYYCFGCDNKGSNSIDFIMNYLKKNFTEAIIHISSMSNININEVSVSNTKIKKPLPSEFERIDYIPIEKVINNLAAYKRNNLYIFFINSFPENVVDETFQKYNVGSCLFFGNGTTAFIQKDLDGNIRQVKAIMYDAPTGKRLRDKNFSPKIIGRELVGYDKNLKQCLFGVHLLKGNNLPIGIVESEKTACISSIYYPQFIWIATGGKNGCKWTDYNVCKVLENRNVVLFPDKGIDCFNLWEKKSIEIQDKVKCNIMVSDILIKNAISCGINEGEDLADCFLKNILV